MSSRLLQSLALMAALIIVCAVPARAQDRAVILSARAGVTPYILAGGGAVTFHEKGTSGLDKTKGAGRFALGVDYGFRRTGLQMFAQADAFVYGLKNLVGSLAGFDRTQVDVVYSGGVSCRLPF